MPQFGVPVRGPRRHSSHPGSKGCIHNQRIRVGGSTPWHRLGMGAAAGSPSAEGRVAAGVRVYEGTLAAPGRKFGIVVARFNSLITKPLLEGALEALRKANVEEEHVHVAWVPGSVEIPLVAKSMAQTGQFDAIICIGAIIRGATTHYDEVCSAATTGCQNASLSTGVPVVFGIITTEDMEQALDRAGGKVGNKGYEAAVTAVEMATLLSTLNAESVGTEMKFWD